MKKIQKEDSSKSWRSLLSTTFVCLVLFVLCLFSLTPQIINSPLINYLDLSADSSAAVKLVSIKKLENDIKSLHLKLDRLVPGGAYLVINTSDNTFFLYKNRKLEREGICSTGSFIKLELDTQRSWLFETPKGVFTIKGKLIDPVWRKPDWAFVEEGVPIPAANDPSRFEYGVLGDYALNLGRGYLIHGTLYQRLLGLSVTHGCIRMNDADLEAVYSTLPVGAKVFIY